MMVSLHTKIRMMTMTDTRSKIGTFFKNLPIGPAFEIWIA